MRVPPSLAAYVGRAAIAAAIAFGFVACSDAITDLGTYSRHAGRAASLVSELSTTGFEIVRLQVPPDGQGTVSDVDDHGHAVGSSFSSAIGTSRAVMWQLDGSMTDLNVGDHSGAVAMNESHEIIGFSPGGPFRWKNGVVTHFTPSSPASAVSINESGMVAGHFLDLSGPVAKQRSVVWGTDNQVAYHLQDPPGFTFATAASSINDNGVVVGYAQTDGGAVQVGAGWDATGAVLFTTPPVLFDINNAGQAAAVDGSQLPHLIYRREADGTLTPHVAFSDATKAVSIDRAGRMVGYGFDFTAFRMNPYFWGAATPQDLGRLDDQPDAFAFSINNAGKVGGQSGGVPVLWTVPPPPPTATCASVVAELVAAVQSLVTSGALNGGNGNALRVKLKCGDTLKAFINQVNAFEKARKLTAAQAQQLRERAALAMTL